MSASRDLSRAVSSALVDLSKIKPGDEVAIRFTVKEVDHRDAWPHVECGPGDLDGGICESDYVSAGVAAIVSHTPKALAVGDRVQTPGGRTGRIAGINGCDAWIHTDLDPGKPVYITELLFDLERAL